MPLVYALMDLVVAPLLQSQDCSILPKAVVAVRVTLSPVQNEVGPEGIIMALLNPFVTPSTITGLEDAVQPLKSVMVTE